jgi:hypothetical protein
MKVLNALNAHRILPGSEWGEHDERAITLDDLPHFVHSAEQDTVDLGRRDLNILHENSQTVQQFVHPALGLVDCLGILAGDEHLLGVSALSVGRAVAVRL